MVRTASPTPPKAKMTGIKSVLSFGFAAIFDFLTFIFVMFVFTAPFLIGTAAAVAASQTGWLSWIPSSVVASVAGGGAAAAEIFLPPVAAAVSAFGLLMSIIIGFMGGLFMAIWFWVFCRVRPWGSGKWVVAGGGASMVPFINMLPAFLLSTWAVVHSQRKVDKAERRKWEAAHAKQAREQEMSAHMLRARQSEALMRARQEEAASDTRAIPEEYAQAA
jgi:hypothetical protein